MYAPDISILADDKQLNALGNQGHHALGQAANIEHRIVHSF